MMMALLLLTTKSKLCWSLRWWKLKNCLLISSWRLENHFMIVPILYLTGQRWSTDLINNYITITTSGKFSESILHKVTVFPAQFQLLVNFDTIRTPQSMTLSTFPDFNSLVNRSSHNVGLGTVEIYRCGKVVVGI